MKTFVIGDIHGRCAQLYHLLDLLPRDESTDTLIFLGDLIEDRKSTRLNSSH